MEKFQQLFDLDGRYWMFIILIILILSMYQNFAKEKGIMNKSPFYKTPQTMTGDLNWK